MLEARPRRREEGKCNATPTAQGSSADFQKSGCDILRISNHQGVMALKTRQEKDSLGEKLVPAGAYYGIQTQRAVENYPISGARAHAKLIRAMG